MASDDDPLPGASTRETDAYVARITPWQAGHPRFVETVRGVVAPHAEAGAVVASLPEAFDLDEAIGAQLDVDGELIGRSRRVLFALVDPYFAFDRAGLGFDEAVWKGPFDRSFGSVLLDDETYRRLLRSKILANGWDGTVEGAQAALDAYFADPEVHVFVQDDARAQVIPTYFAFDDAERGFDVGEWGPSLFAFDMPGRGFDEGRWRLAIEPSALPDALGQSMTIVVSGKRPPLIDLAVLSAGLIPIKPAGVAVDVAVSTVDGAPAFGFDVDNEFIGGFDTGAWGASPEFVATLGA